MRHNAGHSNKGHLEGYLLHRTCVFKALRLFFLPNFPGPTFIPEARVASLQIEHWEAGKH